MTSEEERQAFYFSIGFAISQWAHVEAALARAFGQLVLAGDRFAANAAFFAAINFSTKLEMIDAAAKAHFLTRPELFAEWSALSNKTLLKSKIRNALAHFTSVIRVKKGDKYRYYLEQSVFDLNHRLAKRSPRYNYNNISNEAYSFAELAEKLSNFATKIAEVGQPQAPP